MIAYFGVSQCTPDPQYTQPGYYSSAGKNKLPQAYIHVPYDDTITVIAPKDTTFQGNTFTVDSLTLVSITGLPDTLTYSAPTYTFYPNTPGCIKVSGTPGKAGKFKLDFDVVIYITGSPQGLQRTEKFDFEVLDTSATASIKSNWANEQISIAPNPAQEKFQVLLRDLNPEKLEISIHNLVGEKVFVKKYDSVDTQDPIWVNTSDFPSGIYIYTIATPLTEKAGRLIITE
jgi:hypothetical protein